jgi:phospho-N-acetylmuramoyl-pentapeptide-transferase
LCDGVEYPVFSGYNEYLTEVFGDFSKGLFDEVGCRITEDEKADLAFHQEKCMEALCFLQNLSEDFNLNYYLVLVFICNFCISYVFIKTLISVLKRHTKFQPIRSDGPETHFQKVKTPTMGGLVFNLSIIINILLFCDLYSPYTWIILFLIVGFMLIGLTDDIIKVFFKDSFGFRGSIKLILELLIGSITILSLAYFDTNYLTDYIKIPIFNTWLNLGLFSTPFFIVALVGSANATNITDGLD